MKETVEEIVAEIVAAGPTATSPPEIVARINALQDGPHAQQVADLRMILWGTAAAFVNWAEEKGYDREAAMRIAAQSLEAGAAMFIKRLYEQLGRPFSPGRFSIVAFTMAEHAQTIMTEADIARGEALLAEFEAEAKAEAEEAKV